MGSDSGVSQRSTKEKVLPLPSWLSTVSRPPISATMRFEMLSPRPVQPYLRVVEESTCVKLSKMEPIFSLGMPMPVSEMEKRRDFDSV